MSSVGIKVRPLGKATSLSISIGPATKAFQSAFNIGLNEGTSYKAGLKQCFDLRVRP